MAWTLLETTYDYFSKDDILRMYNSSAGTSYTEVGIAILAVGASTFALAIKEKAHPIMAATLAAVGMSITYGQAFDLLSNSLATSGFRDAIEDMLNNNGSYVQVKTERYQWSSGSGNHYTWKTENTYAYV